MKNVRIKCFIASKDPGGGICQDSLAVNLLRGRFAVADGVTNSNHPEILSRLLSEAFVKDNLAVMDWTSDPGKKLLLNICKEWKKQENDLFSSLTGRKRLHAQLRRNYYSAGASTLAGIEIDKEQNTSKYLILGDSTLFVIGDNDNYFAINSSAKSETKGQLIPFDNNPGSIVAEGFSRGEWVSGEFTLQPGFVALMTDGCANWFQESFATDSTTIKKLWELHDNNDFTSFIQTIWSQNPKYEDDWALILIKLDEELFDMECFPLSQPQALFIGDS